MPRTPRTPRQERSRATVDAIVEAGFICVAQRGVANTTTRHIAEHAGIGVGSLYEYFANKEEIFDAMNRRFVADMEALIRRLTPQMLDKDIEPAVELMFRGFGDFLTANDERYLKVARQIVQADTKDYVEPVSKALQDLLLGYLMAHPELLRLPNLQTMTWILINAGIFTVLRQLSTENPPVTFAQLSTGLADLIHAYVEHRLGDCSGPVPAPRAAARRRPSRK
jgi:AcrR family transcriptional regulator